MEKQTQTITLIKKLLENEYLSPSARTFVASLLSWSQEKPLTRRQKAALRRIEYNYFGEPYETNQYKTWTSNWNKQKQETLMICAKYYIENPPYFNELCHRIVSDKQFIPTEQQYRSMTDNKYSKKVLESYRAPAIFSIGELVCRRKGSPGYSSVELPMTVLEINVEPIISAAKGSKRYRVLPLGTTSSHIVEERYLKKYHKLKKNT